MTDPTSLTTSALLIRALRRWGDRPAFTGHGGVLSYRGALDLFARTQAVLKAAGVRPGERIAMLHSNRADAWLAGTAAQALGLCSTALHPQGALDDHLFILEDAEADYLLVDAGVYRDRGGELHARCDRLKDVFTIGRADYGRDLLAAVEAVGTATATVEAESSQHTMLSYTGGTTGKSKGAIRRHPSALAMFNGILADFELPSNPSYLSVAPISHVGGTKILPVLVRGGRVHMHHGFDPDRIFSDIASQRVSMMLLVPTMIYMLLDHPGLADADLSSLELLLYGASPISPSRLHEGLERIGPVFSQLYGQTECYPVSVLRREDHDPARPELFQSCGAPCSSVDIALLDGEHQEVSTGDVGEICVRAPQMMEEYWRRPEQTAETMAGGWVHTGDMARADEQGLLYIVDRKKDMIISGGFNIYPKEIEDVLSADPNVAQAAVIGVPDEKWGESVTAIVVPRAGCRIDGRALIERVKAQKGSVMAPKMVDVVDEIPVTAIGKPDKKALRDTYWRGQDRGVS
jgi:fatty-acyl-CoA synthase